MYDPDLIGHEMFLDKSPSRLGLMAPLCARAKEREHRRTKSPSVDELLLLITVGLLLEFIPIPPTAF